jgi:glyoxylate reductase
MTDRAIILALPPVPANLMPELTAVGDVVTGGKDGDIAPVGPDLLARADAVLTGTRVKFDRDRFEQMPKLRVISNFAVGTDNVDIAEATRRGILVTNTPGVLDRAVADLTVGLIIATGRKIPAAAKFVTSGQWMASRFPPTSEISGKTLGILGLGRIGQQVARRARGFDMTILYHQPPRDLRAEAELGAIYVERDELFRRSDWVSLHLPDLPETRKSVGARELALMKPTSVLVNLSRGTIVDEPALIDALQAQRIAGAALDVMAKEPIGPDHPLAQLESVILSPHVGSSTVETRHAMMEMAIGNLVIGLSGRRPSAVVNPEVLTLARGSARG